ncbi:Hypothetical predicted protein [Octopus vulgaris]|uniref:Uncharacterized protein n=1 Tax=Octopus vulgaris TaxID=6645 RepID=A0AA36AW57_OCTVU|nr:Hypothetical predicted protein [Octopus vulgaris]
MKTSMTTVTKKTSGKYQKRKSAAYLSICTFCLTSFNFPYNRTSYRGIKFPGDVDIYQRGNIFVFQSFLTECILDGVT